MTPRKFKTEAEWLAFETDLEPRRNPRRCLCAAAWPLIGSLALWAAFCAWVLL